jgi:polysaccharide pyruvyl transferase WcaK-like protein
MKIYLFNRSGSDNIGDQLIGKVIESELHKMNFEVVINKVYPNPQNIFEKIKTHIKSYFIDIRLILISDSLIIGGGNLIMDSAGIGWAVHQFWLSLLCLIFNKPYYYLTVGANPLVQKYTKLLYSFSLKNAFKVSVRDSFSKQYVESLTGRDDIELIFDPVFKISSIFPQETSKNGCIGVCPVQLNHPSIGADVSWYERYIKLHVDLVNYFIESGKDVCLFINDPDIDALVFQNIHENIPSNTLCFQTKDSFSTLSEYLLFISKLEFLISSRMHALITATSYGVPSVGLGWQPKMKYCMQDQRMEGYFDVLENLQDDISAQRLFDSIIHFYESIKDEPYSIFSNEFKLKEFLNY